MQEQITDIAMWAGEKYYPWPSDFSNEAERLGVSKRIPRGAIPEITKGRSRLAIIHPKAIAEVTAENMTLHDLALELYTEYLAGPGFVADDFDPYEAGLIDEESGRSMLGLIDLLQRAESDNRKDGDGPYNYLDRLEEKYGIVYLPGYIGYTYITGIEYSLCDDENELPPDLEGKGVEAVRDIYEEET